MYAATDPKESTLKMHSPLFHVAFSFRAKLDYIRECKTKPLVGGYSALIKYGPLVSVLSNGRSLSSVHSGRLRFRSWTRPAMSSCAELISTRPQSQSWLVSLSLSLPLDLPLSLPRMSTMSNSWGTADSVGTGSRISHGPSFPLTLKSGWGTYWQIIHCWKLDGSVGQLVLLVKALFTL